MTPANSSVQQGTPEIPTSAQPDPRGNSDLFLVILLGVLWGSAFPVIRAGIVAGAPALIFASVRYLITAAALVVIALVAGAPRPRRSDLAPPLVFGGLFMIATYGGLLYVGEETTSGGLAAVLTASAPLLSALIGFRLLPSERFGRWGILGLLVGFIGVAVLVLPGLVGSASTGFAGPMLVIGAVLAFAIGSVLLRRTSRATPGFWTLSMQFAVAGVAVGLSALLAGEPATLGRTSVVLPDLAFLVAVPGVVGYTLYFRIHHTSGPARANVVGYVNPVTGVLVGLLIFGETVTGIELGGLLLIAGGLFLLQRDRRHLSDSRRSPHDTTTEPGLSEPGPSSSRLR